MINAKFTTRFAPSPTGHLHLGHAFSAFTVFDAAKAQNGRCILRLEDIDQSRCQPEFEKSIYEDLAWLGLEWETPVRRQSDHTQEYKNVLSNLIKKGVVYRCFKTRKEITDEMGRAPHLPTTGLAGPAFVGAPLGSDEEQALIASGASFAWRLSQRSARDFLGQGADDLAIAVEKNGTIEEITATPEIFGDAVIGRKGVGTSYHLASVYDDAIQGVSHVIRGEDLRSAAHLHRLLQALLNLPPPIYRYHRLITDKNGRRLTKRDKDETLCSMRASGRTPDDVRQELFK